MNKLVYVIFYGLGLLSLILALFGAMISSALIEALIKSGSDSNVLIFLGMIPGGVFTFLILQDLNYKIIHLLGYVAKPHPRIRHRQIAVPDLVPSDYLMDNDLKYRKLAKYRYRLAHHIILSAVIFLVIIIFAVIIKDMNSYKTLLIVYTISMILLISYLEVKLEKYLIKRNFKLAYVENDRKFYYIDK